MKGLEGRVAIITGGLGDLGYAAGKRLAEEGCAVALLDIKEDSEKAAAIGCRSWTVDLIDEDAIETTCKSIREELGSASILINSAARFILKGIDAAAPAIFHLRNHVFCHERGSAYIHPGHFIPIFRGGIDAFQDEACC